MARTRTASAREAIESQKDNRDHSERIDDEDDEFLPTTDYKPDSSVAFKTAIERFRHNDVKNENGEPSTISPTSTHANIQQRPRDPVLKRKNPTPPAPSPSPAKRQRKSSKYAPPSKYAHLKPLQDILSPNLICIFVGTNPGIRTATAGHAYAHPSNLFWKLLHSSGCTDERLKPEQDVDLPRLYSMGNTNIVERPSKDAAELSKAEMAAGTPVLEAKVRKFRPEAVCIVGKGIWEAVWRWRYQREIKKGEFRYGWQDERERMGRGEGWEGARVFVASSTSGLSASTRPHEKEAIWRPFGEWVKMRREERAAGEKHTSGASEVKEELRDKP